MGCSVWVLMVSTLLNTALASDARQCREKAVRTSIEVQNAAMTAFGLDDVKPFEKQSLLWPDLRLRLWDDLSPRKRRVDRAGQASRDQQRSGRNRGVTLSLSWSFPSRSRSHRRSVAVENRIRLRTQSEVREETSRLYGQWLGISMIENEGIFRGDSSWLSVARNRLRALLDARTENQFSAIVLAKGGRGCISHE
jgi:hypothetical protein